MDTNGTMKRIVIPVSKNNPEDEYLSLVEILSRQFGGAIVRVSDALVIETDVPQVWAMFEAMTKDISIREVNTNGKKYKATKYNCVDCGAPCSKPGSRCKTCAMKLVGVKNRKNRASVNLSPDEGDELGVSVIGFGDEVEG